jgi:dTDP-4-dehydrorhamnose 3,5-epimerase
MFKIYPPTPLGVTLIHTHPEMDGRGFSQVLCDLLLHYQLPHCGEFVLDYLASSHRAVLRGLHLPRYEQGKLITVVQGQIFDVVVDCRKNSPTYGQYEGRELSEHEGRMLWIPPGFAHGYYVLSAWSEVLYKMTAPHFPDMITTIHWADPTLGIKWPYTRDTIPETSLNDMRGIKFVDVEAYK